MFPSLLSQNRRLPQLREKRVLLRVPTMEDFPAWAALREESREFLVPWEPSWPLDGLTKASFRRRLRYYAVDRRQGVGLAFFVFRIEDNALLGSFSLSNLRRGVAQSANLGYWIGQPFADQGYGAEALSAVVSYSFSKLGLNRLEAATLPENMPSQNLLKKIGFVKEGFARKYLKINGKWCDHVLYGLLQDEFYAAQRAKAEGRGAPSIQPLGNLKAGL